MPTKIQKNAKNISKNSQELQIRQETQLSLTRSTRLIRRTLDLKDCRIGLSLILLSNLDHICGPRYLIKNVSRNVRY